MTNLQSEQSDVALSWHSEQPLLRFHTIQTFGESVEFEVQDQEYKVQAKFHQCEIPA